MQKRKIAYISGTRADLGLMAPVLEAIKKSKKLKLKLYVTGMHLMPQIEGSKSYINKAFPGVRRIDSTFGSDRIESPAIFAGDFLGKVVRLLNKDRPDLVLILGDRVEMLCVAVACLYLRIPTAHIHGGDKSVSVEEIARHAITKLSSLHFPATKDSARRIRLMGEDSWRIKIVGAPGIDRMTKGKIPSRKELYKKLDLDPSQGFVLVTQHPVTGEEKESVKQIKSTLEAVKKFKIPVVITYPHADPSGKKMIDEINKNNRNKLFRIYKTLGDKYFVAAIRDTAVWVGNSSAGIIESATFRTPVVNIGTRRMGSLKAKNIIDVGYNKKEIEFGIKKAMFDKSFLRKIAHIKNPYGDGKSGDRICRVLEKIDLDSKLLLKQISY